MHLNLSWPAVSQLGAEGRGQRGRARAQARAWAGGGAYSQLQAEGDAQHLEALHLEVHPDGRLVVLVERVLAEPGAGARRGSAGRLPGASQRRGLPGRDVPLGTKAAPGEPEPQAAAGTSPAWVGGGSLGAVPRGLPGQAGLVDTPEPARGRTHRLMRQVLPTDRSPTTMILEILNLPGRGGTSTLAPVPGPAAGPGSTVPAPFPPPRLHCPWIAAPAWAQGSPRAKPRSRQSRSLPRGCGRRV